MNLAEEKEWIARAVADLRAACQLPEDPLRRGPVPLERFLAEHALRLVELPRLSRAAVYDYLLAMGSLPGDLGEDEDLAGFLSMSGPFGRVFVNADDPVTRRRSASGRRSSPPRANSAAVPSSSSGWWRRFTARAGSGTWAKRWTASTPTRR